MKKIWPFLISSFALLLVGATEHESVAQTNTVLPKADTRLITLGTVAGPPPRPHRAQFSNLLIVNGTPQLEVAKAVAVARGLEVVVLETSTSGGFDEAFQRLGDDKRSGIIHLSSPGFSAIAPRFAAAAEKYRLPSIAFLKSYASTGVLATYGPQQETYFSRAAAMTQKILKGEKAGDIPIEQPTKYELVINLKTAKALGLTVSPALLARADEVIE